MKKYSIKATSRTAALLIKFDIPFVCTFGIRSGLHRLFFLANEDDYKAIEAATHFSIHEEDEDLGLDFAQWDAIQ